MKGQKPKVLDFGIVVALPLECAAVLTMFDRYERLSGSTADPNTYYRGEIAPAERRLCESQYEVVLAQCPKMGNNGAAMVAKDLIRTFSVKHVLLVGIAAGIPCINNGSRHVRLGDVVVSYGKGVVQYDMVKRRDGGSLEVRSSLPPPSRILLGGVDALEVERLQGIRRWESLVGRAGELGTRPSEDTDKLYVWSGTKNPRWRRAAHPPRPFAGDEVAVHRGLIGSGNCLLKDVRERDRLATELGILAVEMEGAGVADATWNQTEVADYLIIRGVSDYADRRKNDLWQPYAASVAAAYMRALLDLEPVPPRSVVAPSTEPESRTSLRRVGPALGRYLRWTRNITQDVIIRDDRRVVGLPLEKSFVDPGLTTSDARLLGRTGRDTGPRLELLDLWPERASVRSSLSTEDTPIVPALAILGLGTHAVVVGGPGSGKTTLLRYLANCCAGRLIEPAYPLPEALDLEAEPPVPILLPLNAFAHYLKSSDAADAPHIQSLLGYSSLYIQSRQALLGLPSDFFLELAIEGRPLLIMLDALEEIPDRELQIRVSRAIHDLGCLPYNLRILLTARTSAYRAEALLPSPFVEFSIRPLDEERVAEMVAVLVRLMFDTEPEQNKAVEEVTEAVMTLEAGRRVLHLGHGRFVDTPLMVRIITTLQMRTGHVARQRSRVLSDYIDTQLRVSYNPDIEVGERLAKLAGGPELQRRLLAKLAFKLHSEMGAVGRPKVDLMDAREVLLSELKRHSLNEDASDLARGFLEVVQQRGGLLETEGTSLSFSHLRFQEFLAGEAMAESLREGSTLGAFVKGIESSQREWWQEPLSHCLGVIAAESPALAEDLVGELLELTTGDLASETLSVFALMGAAEAAVEHGLSSGTKSLVAEVILQILELDPGPQAILCRERAELGRLLCLLGDPRTDVSVTVPTVVEIPAGTFTMGHRADPKLTDLPSLVSGEYAVSVESFGIGAYPVTRGQFAAFVEVGGYSEEGTKFWTEVGWDWRTREGVERPAYWTAPDRSLENYPAVGVSWFEAYAYCQWLGYVTGRPFRLPTEPEWELAAGGGKIWPWGNEFVEGYANTSESGISGTTAVGIFPLGASAAGLYDCAGNVWEWCSSEFRTYGPYQDDGREDANGNGPRCIRGGSWLNSADRARVANRDHYFPGDRHFDLGFRIAEGA